MMVTVRARRALAAALMLSALALIAAGCSREQQDWRSAEGADTIEAYGQFMERHPESELAAQARTRVAQLGEDRDWQRAGSADTADAYRQFLTQHPNGKWAQEARIRVENFSLGGTPVAEQGAALAQPAKEAQVVPTPVAAAGPPAAGPPAGAAAHAPPPASIAPQTPSSAENGYGVQLGAFSSEDKANEEWRVLSGRFGPQLKGLTPHVVPTSTASGTLFRLQAHAADEAQARAVCDALRKQAQACVPVVPH